MSNPANVALYGHRFQPWLKNNTTGSTKNIDRVQSFDPNYTAPTVKYHELGRVGPVGTTQGPPQVRITIEQNLTDDFDMEYILSGKGLNPAGAQQYHMGNIVTYAGLLTAWLLARNQDDTILHELECGLLAVTDLTYRHTNQGASSISVGLQGSTIKVWQAANVIHPAWGTLDNTSFGGVHGKDVRAWLSTGSTATARQYRLQQMTVRAAFPSQFVTELGNRNNAGVMADSPDVTVDLDILQADDQPLDALYTLTGNAYDLAQPLTPFNARIRMFDPNNTEGGSAFRMFLIENLVPQTGSPGRAQVRGLATQRYSLLSSKETTLNGGGLIVSNRNDL